MRPKDPDLDPLNQPVGLRVSIGERLDPAAADALWRLVLRVEASQADGVPVAEGDGPPRQGHRP